MRKQMTVTEGTCVKLVGVALRGVTGNGIADTGRGGPKGMVEGERAPQIEPSVDRGTEEAVPTVCSVFWSWVHQVCV